MVLDTTVDEVGALEVVEDPRQTEMTQFLNNIALAGGALAALGFSAWDYSIGIPLF